MFTALRVNERGTLRLVMYRGNMRRLTNNVLELFVIDASMEEFNQNSNLSIFLHLQSSFKGPDVGLEVIKILIGQTEHGLRGSNMEEGTFLLKGL